MYIQTSAWCQQRTFSIYIKLFTVKLTLGTRMKCSLPGWLWFNHVYSTLNTEKYTFKWWEHHDVLLFIYLWKFVLHSTVEYFTYSMMVDSMMGRSSGKPRGKHHLHVAGRPLLHVAGEEVKMCLTNSQQVLWSDILWVNTLCKHAHQLGKYKYKCLPNIIWVI